MVHPVPFHIPPPLIPVCLPSSLFQLLRVCFLSQSIFCLYSNLTCLLRSYLTFVPLFLPPVGPDYKCDELTEFSCRTNYRCVPQWARCDGTNDCIDNSDEEGCGQFFSSVSFWRGLSVVLMFHPALVESKRNDLGEEIYFILLFYTIYGL